MSSADSKDNAVSVKGLAKDESAEETSEAERSINAEKRAARQARRDEASSGQVTIPVRTLKLIGGAVVALLVVGAFAFGGWQLYQNNQRLNAFDDSKAAAAHFVTTYFDAMGGPNASAESLREAVGPLTTGQFKERLSSDAVVSTDFMKQNKVENMKTTVTSSMVESFDADEATVVLGVDVTGTSAASAGGGRNAILLQIEMTKVDGDWLVSSIGAGPGVTVGAQQGEQTAPVPGETPAPAPEPAPAP
ncbi:hypothetical protein [Gordonia sp. (in: high G+C Gram-positive bacteria)]|uniref:hypothetical protein n=1 Tax=Gordonia sp. (in: high G+C Gram-positive bacteria) TaxID=84139 RepID=UPI0025C6916C|nr:hypothetical protein [Gordonia sp. (in: high G+C Gram-positive bacteria)]